MTSITAAVADGTALGHLLLPTGDAPCSLVVFYPDAGGVRPAMFDMAAHLTGAGHAVLMVDPYWRHGEYAPFDARTVFSDPAERARLMGMATAVRPENVLGDTDALIARVDPARVRRERVGAIGYCMGGRLAFLAAARRPERIVAAAAIHAGNLVTDAPESPHRLAGGIRAALYLGVADEDASCTPEHQRILREALDAAGVRHQLELYPGARHGFAVPDFAVYDADAAARHWQRVLALFAAHL